MTREMFEIPVIVAEVLVLAVNWATRRSCTERIVDGWVRVTKGPGRIPWMWLVLAVFFNVVLPVVIGYAGGVGLGGKTSLGVAAVVASSVLVLQLMYLLQEARRAQLKASVFFPSPLWLLALVAGMEASS